MKIRLIRPYKHYDTGFILDVTGGVADVLVSRRRPPIAEYVDAPQTLVPVMPGLSQLVESVVNATRPRKKNHAVE